MTSPVPKGWRPFSNGSEYHAWADENCFSCIKGYDEEGEKYRCPLEAHLMDPGGIPKWVERRIGTRMVEWKVNGASGSYKVMGDCLERVRRGDSGPSEEPRPMPDAPGQRFLWTDLYYARTDADRAELEKVTS